MKNVTEIKAEAKEQIIKLLDMCKCYTYTDEGIDKWLDEWEKACSPQIEAIAEKSPYYDGKCKIVFPSEYPREIDTYEIDKFSKWLNKSITNTIQPVKFNGLSYSEIQDLKRIYQATQEFVYQCQTNNYNKIFKNSTIETIINEYNSSDFQIKYQSYCTARRELEMRYHCDEIEFVNDEYYLKSELKTYGYDAAQRLSQILRNNYAKKQFLDEKLQEVLSYHFSQCKFTVGQKLSRAVNRIALKYGISKCEGWNSAFAKYADAINPLNITKWTVISWHPVDYLTFCFGNSWSTCSNIDKHNVRGIKIGSSRSSITSYVNEDYVFRGEHSAAALSYMFDKSSFIYYTVNHKYNGTHYEEQDKESRIVFSLNEDMDTLLQSRLYPQCNDDNPNDMGYQIPREIIQKVIAQSLDVPNLWKVKKGRDACCEYASSSGVHYPDYTDSRNKNCNISWRGEQPKAIQLGHDAICPKCGKLHTYTGSLNCKRCDPEYN